MNPLENMFQHLIEPPFVYLVFLALVLLVALYLLRNYRRAHQGIVPFKSQGGTIEIAPQTLRGVMQNAVNSVEGVEKAACRHFLKGRQMGVRVAVHLVANHPLREVETLVKQRIRATLLDQFGMESVEPIHIRVTRIIGDPVATVTQPGPDREEAETEAFPDDFNRRESEDDRPYSDETKL